MTLLLIMGIPAAGKSTFIRNFPHPNENLSFDQFRQDQDQNEKMQNARQARKLFQKHVEEWIAISSGSNSRIYLIEDIFHLQSMRRPFQKIARKFQMKFGVVYLKIGLEIAITRNSMRTIGKVNEETIRKVAENLEEPVDPIEDVERFLEARNANDTVTVSTVQKTGSQPDVSNDLFDVTTRRLVTQLKTDDPSLDGKLLSRARKQILLLDHVDNPELKPKLLAIYTSML